MQFQKNVIPERAFDTEKNRNKLYVQYVREFTYLVLLLGKTTIRKTARSFTNMLRKLSVVMISRFVSRCGIQVLC